MPVAVNSDGGIGMIEYHRRRKVKNSKTSFIIVLFNKMYYW